MLPMLSRSALLAVRNNLGPLENLFEVLRTSIWPAVRWNCLSSFLPSENTPNGQLDAEKEIERKGGKEGPFNGRALPILITVVQAQGDQIEVEWKVQN